jgi:hypothetical protein
LSREATLDTETSLVIVECSSNGALSDIKARPYPPQRADILEFNCPVRLQ